MFACCCSGSRTATVQGCCARGSWGTKGPPPPSRALPWPHPHGQVGVFECDPSKAAALIREWLTTKRGELAAMAARAKALGKPEALFDIVGDLATLCKAPQLQLQAA